MCGRLSDVSSVLKFAVCIAGTPDVSSVLHFNLSTLRAARGDASHPQRRLARHQPPAERRRQARQRRRHLRLARGRANAGDPHRQDGARKQYVPVTTCAFSPYLVKLLPFAIFTDSCSAIEC